MTPELMTWLRVARNIRSTCQNVEAFDALIAAQEARLGIIRHGETRVGKSSAEYVVWRNMNNRCYNPKDKSFDGYGGRGVEVCVRWRLGENGKHPLICFIEDMGRRPSDDHSIDRRDNDGNYCKENCHWVTSKEQANNRRDRPNKTGFPGVWINNDKYSSSVTVNGSRVYLGIFDTPEEAAEAYKLAKMRGKPSVSN